MYAEYEEAAQKQTVQKQLDRRTMRLVLTVIRRLILFSKLVSIVSGSPLLQRLVREEGSVRNSPLSLTSLCLGIIRPIKMLRIL